MANMLVIFGLVTYSTKGVSFGGIDQSIPGKIIPKVGGIPTIILWAVAAVAIVWFIWNKTRFGKNLYAVGGNPEAASVSGISVFKVTTRFHLAIHRTASVVALSGSVFSCKHRLYGWWWRHCRD